MGVYATAYNVDVQPVEVVLQGQIVAAGLPAPVAIVIATNGPPFYVDIRFDVVLTQGQQLTLSGVMETNYTVSEPPPPEPGPGAAGLQCDPSVVVNDLVFVDTAGMVQQASAASIATAPAVGLVLSKPSATFVVAQVGNGIVGPLMDDQGNPVVPGTTYYLSPTVAGKITPTPPSQSGEVLQEIGIGLLGNQLLLFLDGNVVLL
jgi:hypothetical protein